MKNKTFNLVVTGYGGQGVLTIVKIITTAALKQGYDIKESELHGLAQRGGSLNCHVRFGDKVHSPLVPRGEADLIISLEALEALRACYWANKDTNILTNSKVFRSSLSLKEILSKIKKFTKKVYCVEADKIVEKETGDIMGTNVFMVGYSVSKNALPLKEEFLKQAITEVIRREKEMNEKLFDIASKKSG